MNPERILQQYKNGRTPKWLATEHDTTIDIIRGILQANREQEKAYMKAMQEIARLLPRHKDNEADLKWEAALGQGSFN